MSRVRYTNHQIIRAYFKGVYGKNYITTEITREGRVFVDVAEDTEDGRIVTSYEGNINQVLKKIGV